MIRFLLISIVIVITFTTKLPTLATAASNFVNYTHFSVSELQLDEAITLHNVLNIIDKELTDNPVKTIVIDPGHGGRDPGGVGKKTKEKDIVLSVSLILEDLLNRYFPDINVILTRDSDVFVPLHERASIANKSNADLFLSIHCNIAPNRSQVHGSETFVLGLHRAQENLEVAKRENAVITMEEDYRENYGGYDPNSPEGHIIISAYQNAYLGHSIRFASLVEQEFENTAKRKSRGVKQAGFLVLRQTTMPSVLIEAGFLSNSTEEKYLASTEGQRQIALSILRAIQQYLKDWGYEPIAISNNSKAEEHEEVVDKSEEKPETATADESHEVVEVSESNGKNTYFSVQLMTTSTPIEMNAFDPIENQSFFSLSEEGVYRLLNGKFPDYQAAAEHRAVLKEKGYGDAFIIGVHDQKRVPIAELRSN